MVLCQSTFILQGKCPAISDSDTKANLLRLVVQAKQIILFQVQYPGIIHVSCNLSFLLAGISTNRQLVEVYPIIPTHEPRNGNGATAPKLYLCNGWLGSFAFFLPVCRIARRVGKMRHSPPRFLQVPEL